MKNILIISLTVLFGQFALADEYFEMDENPLYQKLDALARAYNLEQLRSGKGNELRMWYFEPMEGGIDASVFTEKISLNCKGEFDYNHGEVVLKPGSCKKTKSLLSAAELKEKLSTLNKLKEVNTSCDEIMDGWGITIEGVLDKQRFAFESWNPDGCDSEGSNQINKIIDSIEEFQFKP